MDYPPEEKLWRRIQETVVKRDERPPAICDHKTSALWMVALDRFYCIYHSQWQIYGNRHQSVGEFFHTAGGLALPSVIPLHG